MYKCLRTRRGPVMKPGVSFLCVKFVDVHKVMVHAMFQSSRPFGFKHKDFYAPVSKDWGHIVL